MVADFEHFACHLCIIVTSRSNLSALLHSLFLPGAAGYCIMLLRMLHPAGLFIIVC